jgi:3-hydroxybutyryl-CoA dehydrogenase
MSLAISQLKKIGVIGAGTMGQGIAQVCAQSGYTVLLYDVRNDLVETAIDKIKKNISVGIEKGKLTKAEGESAFFKILPQEQFSALQCDLIIEAVVENLEVKQKLFSQLEEINSGETILATNTSSISITQIASKLKNPGHCIGLHFFNPVHLMKLVEIVSGASTDPVLIPLLKEFATKLGKVAVVAKDSPGFIVNRVARHFYVESLKLLEENIAPVEVIDQLMRSTGFKMGPFELMDLIGMDTNFAVTSSVYNGFHQDPKFRPSRIQQQKVDAGHLGRKTGSGFYDYPKS